MEKGQNNFLIKGLGGSLVNNNVIRQAKGGHTIVLRKPANATRTFNLTQLAQQEAFHNAIAYAKSAKDENIYLTKQQGTTLSAFNVAVGDWFNAPEVLEIDTENWTGAVGQVIRVKAQDDIQVTRVHVQIADTQGNFLKKGPAVQADGLWWVYTTTTTIADPSIVNINAKAYNLPGNSHMLAWQNN